MNFKINNNEYSENTIQNIECPCQIFHRDSNNIAYDHNYCYKMYIFHDHIKNTITNIVKNYASLNKNGVTCEFTTDENNIFFTYYDIIVELSTTLNKKKEDNNIHIIKTSILVNDNNILHKIYTGNKNLENTHSIDKIQILHIFENFYYVYLNIHNIHKVYNNTDIIENNLFRSSFYNAGCVFIILNDINIQDDNNVIDYIVKIIQLKKEYYEASNTNIKIIIESNINKYVEKHIYKYCPEINDIKRIIDNIVKMQSQYIYAKCNSNNMNFTILKELHSCIEQYFNNSKQSSKKYILIILLLNSFIHSYKFKQLHINYQNAILFLIKNSSICGFFCNINIEDEITEEVSKYLTYKYVEEKQQAEIFIHINKGSLKEINSENYEIFNIYQFIRSKEQIDSFYA